MNLGITYKNIDSLDKARECYLKAESIAKGLSNKTKLLTLFTPPKSPISPSTQNDKSNSTNLDYKEKPY